MFRLKSKILGKDIQYRHLSGGKCWGYDGEVEKKKDDNYFVTLRLQESKTPRKCIPLPLDLRHLPKHGQNPSKYVDLGLCSICERCHWSNSKHSASCKGTQGASDSIPITDYFSQPGTLSSSSLMKTMLPSQSQTTSTTNNVTTSNSAINLSHMEESSSTSVMNIVSEIPKDFSTSDSTSHISSSTTARLTPIISNYPESKYANGNAVGEYDDSSGSDDDEIEEFQKTSLQTFRKVMKLLFDNICFDVSDTIIPLLPKIMNFKFLQSLNLLFHPAIYALMNCSFFIWDPEKQYDELLQEFKFKCPKPNCKKILQNHGWSKSIRIERTITSNARILVCESYQCYECSQPNPNCRSSSFDVVHPDLMSQLPDSVRIIFPFILNPNGALLSKETLTATMALIENGAKFNHFITKPGNAETISFRNFQEFRTCSFTGFLKSFRRNYA